MKKTIAPLNVIPLGKFEINGPIVISDPCYESPTISLFNVRKGIWYTEIEKGNAGEGWGNRIYNLRCYHEDFTEEEKMSVSKKRFWVDSGQAGVFVESIYRKDDLITESQKFIPEEPWYSYCCEKTLNEPFAGVITGGVVSSTGFGDGEYLAFIYRNLDKNAVQIKLVFIE